MGGKGIQRHDLPHIKLAAHNCPTYGLEEGEPYIQLRAWFNEPARSWVRVHTVVTTAGLLLILGSLIAILLGQYLAAVLSLAPMLFAIWVWWRFLKKADELRLTKKEVQLLSGGGSC